MSWTRQFPNVQMHSNALARRKESEAHNFIKNHFTKKNLLRITQLSIQSVFPLLRILLGAINVEYSGPEASRHVSSEGHYSTEKMRQ